MSYSKEQTQEMLAMYKVGLENDSTEVTIVALASKYNKTQASIIAKLSAEKVYVAKLRKSSVTGDKPKTKAAYVKDICDLLDIEELDTLDKTSKATLIKLKEAIICQTI